MAEKIQRQTQKIFGGQAPNNEVAVFGSFKTGNPIYTDNIEDLQSTAYEQGWSAALVANEAPFMEDMNGVQYGFSKQLAYQFQEGIAEYDPNTTYFIGSMVKALDTNNNPIIYKSIVDDNVGQELNNTDYWIEWVSGADTSLSNLTQEGIDNIKQYTNGGTSLPLFTPILQDHVLSFDESKGYALQGTYVYKQSAPERYGYPDFYAKCLEEKAAGVETQTTLGETTITTYNNANGHIYYDIADKDTVDTFFETYGVADMYGVDEENERVFLPRNRWFMQLAVDVADVNKFNAAGLPNITGGTFNAMDWSTPGTGCIVTTNSDNYGASSKGYTRQYLKFDASASNSIYGNSNTVQPISSNKLLYYVVGNTYTEQAVTATTEITTSENDTIPLFTGMYFDFAPNSPSWLKAGKQANSGEIYTSCYNTLVNCLSGNNPYNLKVVEESAMVAGVDYSEYWKVNQDEEYFITPTGTGEEESTAQLYFKVANAVQNLELLDAGQVLEALSEKISREEMKVYITETYANETSGYNVYSNGYCEQWGKRAGGGSQTINLLKPFRDSKYNTLVSICVSESSTTLSAWVASQASDSFTVQNGYGDKYNSNQYPINWRACGYLAEGEY